MDRSSCTGELRHRPRHGRVRTRRSRRPGPGVKAAPLVHVSADRGGLRGSATALERCIGRVHGPGDGPVASHCDGRISTAGAGDSPCSGEGAVTPFEDSGNTAGFTDSGPDGFEEKSNAGGWPCVSPVPLPPPADAGGVRPFDGLTVLPLRRGSPFLPTAK